MAWKPSPHAIHIEAILDPDDASPGSLLIEHFHDPYQAVLGDDSEESLREAAHGYLGALASHPDIGDRLRLPPHWRPALAREAPADACFGWLPFEPARAAHRGFSGPSGSFRFTSPSDDLAMLYASDRMGPDLHLGSGFGLAVATHIRDDGGTRKASFVGMSATLPYGIYWSHPPTSKGLQAFDIFATRERMFLDAGATATMAAAANLEQLVVRGIRIALIGGQWCIERQGSGMRRNDAGVAIPYGVSMLSRGDGSTRVDTILHVTPLVADAAGDARVFDRDPSSARGLPVRPTRNERPDPPCQPVGLDAFRVVRSILAADHGPLEYPAGGAALVKVMPCPRMVPADRVLDPGQARPVGIAAGEPPIRSDDASAVQAFLHARDLVQRLERYGWPDPASYFRLTAPAIKIFYRSGVSPGPGKDGRTVNARVIPEGWPAGALGAPADDTTRPAIQIHLAAADLRRRERKPWTKDGSRAAAVPLGIAADQRWMWHEFGHVLLVASTGELEFRFAHSPGDALAAIVADPESKLPPRLRGSTFPFVFLPRRHDRCATHGWSWSGLMHQELARVPAAQHPRRKGYWSEQILSSSLFRLYRCMGGDTCLRGAGAEPDTDERRRASHYTLYLVMQAMQLMGDARIQPTSTPAQFVHWLRQADRQTGEWAATFAPTTFRRVGGTLAKTIRWAFEAQGLYGTGNGPGAPEPVDIYIEDGRPTRDEGLYGAADYGRGSYVPVSLHWQAAEFGAPAAPAPLWQAHPGTGIVFPDAGAGAEVRVGNRGHVTAEHVAVQLWFAAWPSGKAAPSWPAGPGVWTACQPTGPATRDIAPGPPTQLQAFTFAIDPPPGRHVLFAQATCADDRAHSDPALSLACSYLDTPLADLVANDNNLGLRVVVV